MASFMNDYRDTVSLLSGELLAIGNRKQSPARHTRYMRTWLIYIQTLPSRP